MGACSSGHNLQQKARSFLLRIAVFAMLQDNPRLLITVRWTLEDRMKNWLVALLGLAFSPTVGLAADMPFKTPPPVVPVFNWTGCYVGGNVGGKWAQTRDDVYIPATGNGAFTTTSVYRLGSNTADTVMGGE